MKRMTLALSTLALVLTGARLGHAGGPLPDTREDDFVHVCKGGPNVGDRCSIPTEATDCPRSSCIIDAASKPIRGTATLIAHDTVTDWSSGDASFQAFTLLLEVRGPDGTLHLLSATYQDLLSPRNPPTAPGNVVVLPLDEIALRDVAPFLGGLLFVQPESRLAEQLQIIFGSSAAPALVFTDRRPQLDDHTGDALATVLRFKVKLQFLVPAA
ncbi:hypothetical protein K2Z84_33095 [Candidatus Binatia bacterium]|jgi:hypothetical protein|nr:hypothetical protein [Candidatus Binatia bacterium]